MRLSGEAVRVRYDAADATGDDRTDVTSVGTSATTFCEGLTGTFVLGYSYTL